MIQVMLKTKKRELVLNAAKELGYKTEFNKREKSNRLNNNLIGVVVSDIAHPFYSEVMKGIMQVAEKHKMGVVFYNTEEKPEREQSALKYLKELNVQGIVLSLSGRISEGVAENVAYFQNIKIPVVILDRLVKFTNFNGVLVDSVRGCYKAVELLIKEGHREIAILNDPANSSSGIERLKGCMEAFKDNGVPYNPDNVFYGDFTSESGYKITKKILAMDKRPTAIFITNNVMTVGCTRALMEERVNIPVDIAVIGFDDYKMYNNFNFNITAVRRHTIQMGEIASNLLFELMENAEALHTIPPKTIITDPDHRLQRV